jgi:hypothetical protein
MMTFFTQALLFSTNAHSLKSLPDSYSIPIFKDISEKEKKKVYITHRILELVSKR